jgi:hypothetical protein
VLYQGIFRDAAAAHNLKLPPLYPLPITGAANYSFLYALLRLLMETPCSRLLEIGVGQSTLLVDAVRKMRGNIDVISIDTDSAWVSHIAGRVGGELGSLQALQPGSQRRPAVPEAGSYPRRAQGGSVRSGRRGCQVNDHRRLADEVDDRRIAEHFAWLDERDRQQHVTFSKPLFSLVVPLKGLYVESEAH